MLKYVGLLLLFSSAALTGFYAAASLEDKEKSVARMLSFWRQFALQLRCLQSSPWQLVSMLSSQKEFAGDRFVRLLLDSLSANSNFGSAIHQSLTGCGELYKQGIAQIVAPLGDIIGIRDIDSQLAALESVIMRLGELHSRAVETSRQKGGLYRRLGIIGGLLLAVIFL